MIAAPDQPVEPARRRLFGSSRARTGLSVLLVLAVGIGSYLIAASLSSSSTSQTATGRPLPSNGGGAAGPGVGARPGGAGPSSAGGGRFDVASGTVASVGSTSFTVTTRQGTKVTVDVSASTRYSGVTGLSGLKAGDSVIALGSSGGSSVIDASRVIEGAAGRVGGSFGGGGFGGSRGPRGGAGAGAGQATA